MTAKPPRRNTLQGRPWLMIWFRCCHAYARVYRNRTGDAYVGRCPRCLGQVRIPVGERGTTRRMFEAH
ncbi:MAG: hypothetical protein D6824_09510 [Planctomycetota bacterium]|nr:MAG: hypothetical protein D6824_09510 [Planctomycetota bacterium]